MRTANSWFDRATIDTFAQASMHDAPDKSIDYRSTTYLNEGQDEYNIPPECKILICRRCGSEDHNAAFRLGNVSTQAPTVLPGRYLVVGVLGYY